MLRSEAIPNFYAFQTRTGWVSLSGDPFGLVHLAALADLVGARRDTVVYLPLRENGAPTPLADVIPDEGVLDLVLAPKYVALTPKRWKIVRSYKPTGARRVTCPPINPDWTEPTERLHYRQATRGMDRQTGRDPHPERRPHDLPGACRRLVVRRCLQVARLGRASPRLTTARGRTGRGDLATILIRWRREALVDERR